MVRDGQDRDRGASGREPLSRKREAKKSSGPRRRASSPLPVSSRLNTRQEKLRKILVATGGLLNVTKAAEELGVHRSTVWEDLRAVKTLGDPRDLDGWNEDEAIRSTIDFYEHAVDVLIGELRAIQEYEAKKQDEYSRRRAKGQTRIFAPYHTMNLKLGIMNTIAIYRRDLSNFLISIGLIREAPKRLLVDGLGDARDASTVEEIQTEIEKVRADLEALRSRQKEVTGKR